MKGADALGSKPQGNLGASINVVVDVQVVAVISRRPVGDRQLKAILRRLARFPLTAEQSGRTGGADCDVTLVRASAKPIAPRARCT